MKKSLITILSFVVFFAVFSSNTRAGDLSPSSSPSASGFTLENIYQKLANGTDATESNHDLSTSASPGGTFHTLKQIYEAIPTIVANTIKKGTSYLGITGTLTPDGGTAGVGDILSGKTVHLTDDWNLDTGTMTNVGSEDFTPTTSNQTISEGFHDGTGIVDGDSDLTAGNIKSGMEVFGVTGTFLDDEFNGSATSPTDDYGFYTQEKGGVDDYNAGGSMPNDSYSANWTGCNSGNDYCGTNDSSACSGDVCFSDDNTRIIWSDWLDSGTNHTWFWANNCFEPGTAENPGTCVSDGDDACQCVKKTSSKTGCEALGDGDWRLPYQKELMQAYIDGSWGNLIHASGSFWSATTNSNATQYAWRVYLFSGYTLTTTKTTTYDSRCVRFYGN